MEDDLGAADEVGGGDLIRLDVAAIAALSLTFFVALKAYGAARFSLTTASALLADAPVSVLLATLVSYAYYVLPVFSLGLLSWGLWSTSGPGLDRTLLRFAACAGAVVAAGLSPPRYLLPLLAGFVAVLIVDRFAQPSPTKRSKPNDDHPQEVNWLRLRLPSLRRTLPPLSRLVAYYLGFLALVVFALTITRMWTPVEVVTITEGGRHMRFIAHVVNHEGDWTTLLSSTTS